MRIAVCLYGMSSGTATNDSGIDTGIIPIQWQLPAQSIKAMFLGTDYEVDYFIHTWQDPESSVSKEIEDFYRPKLSTYQIPIYPNFEHPFKDEYPNHQTKIQITYSRWYSGMQSNILKEKYENEMGIKYDLVFQTRFDIIYYYPFPFHNMDPENFYISNWSYNWCQPGNKRWFGYPDCYLISSSENMDKMSRLYQKLPEYLRRGGDLQNYVINQLNEDEETFISNHALSRWHVAKEIGIRKERFVGCEYNTWNLIRKHPNRNNPHWVCPWNLLEPFNPYPLEP